MAKSTSDILSILAKVPLGKFRTQMALILRQAMLINGMLQNSEAWSNLSLQDIEIYKQYSGFCLYIEGKYFLTTVQFHTRGESFVVKRSVDLILRTVLGFSWPCPSSPGTLGLGLK